jgi:hypothetical protein
VAVDGATPVRGTVRRRFDGEQHQGIVVDVDSPVPGVLHLFDYSWRGDVFLNAHAYFYGDGAIEAAEALHARWSAWMAARFPMPEPADAAAS